MAKIAIRTCISFRNLDRCVSFKPFSTFDRLNTVQHSFPSCSFASCAALPIDMKALVIKEFGKVNELTVQKVLLPEHTEEEILVRAEAAAINPVDTYIREGFYNKLPKLPAILGKEVAGVIARMGPKISCNPHDLKVGDRVFCMLPNNGGYAQYVACPPEHVKPLSNRLNFTQGAGLYVAYYTAYRALIIRSKLKKNETVFIHGASGGVGLAAIQIAKHYGAIVAGTAGTERGLEVVKAQGADFTINHRRKDHALVAKKALGDKGFDIILENLADIYLGEDGFVLGPNGRIAVVGCRGSVQITPRSLMITEGQILGVSLSSMSPTELEECTKVLLDGIEAGWVRPVIAREYALEDGQLAHYDMINKAASYGKLVFKIDHGSGSS